MTVSSLGNWVYDDTINLERKPTRGDIGWNRLNSFWYMGKIKYSIRIKVLSVTYLLYIFLVTNDDVCILYKTLCWPKSKAEAAKSLLLVYKKKKTTKKPEYIQMESNKKQNWKLKN